MRRSWAALLLWSACQCAWAGSRVESIGMTVRDLRTSVAFYQDVLQFRLIDIRERVGDSVDREYGVFGSRVRVARMALGSERVDLTQYVAPEGRSLPEAARSCDQSFQHIAIVVRDMDEAYERLRRAGVRHASPEPQTLPRSNPDAGGIRAFYFKDPDGHALEIIWFPSDKGDPRWRSPSEALFLGIDHTAIVVRDTQRALSFYRDVLGFRVAGESWNSGPEQERLNNVFGASLHITGLRSDGGPGVELLEYLAPTDCEMFPPDARPNDLLHWETVLTCDSPRDVAMRAGVLGGRLITPRPGRASDGRESTLVRDPDGHAVRAWGPPVQDDSTKGDTVP